MELRQHPPLVGRRTIVAKLVALLADAQVAGRPAAVFLEGPAGIGKSRLVAELIANANDRDFAVLALDHHPLETDRPFSAFRNTRDADTSLPHALYRSLSGLDEVGDGPAITARIVRFETADRIVSALVEWSELRPLLLTVDDLQWADEATLVVLHRLAMRLESARIALVCAARPFPRRASLDLLIDDLTNLGRERVFVDGIDRDAALRLAKVVLGATPGDRLAGHIIGAAGNPFFIHEVLTVLLDEDLVEHSAGVAEIRASLLPPSLRMILIRRLSFLPPETVELLRLASVLGRSFSFADLELLIDRPAIALAPIVAPATVSGLVIPQGDEFAFAHDLIRDALYEDMPLAQRRAMHRSLGERLAAADRPPTLVATHLSLGATSGDMLAIDWLRRAAGRVIDHAPTIAVDLIERAIAIARPDLDVRESLSVELVTALIGAGRLSDAEATASAALADSPSAATRRQLHRVLSEALFLDERHPESATELELALADPAWDPLERGRLTAQLAGLLIPEGEFERGSAVANDALEMAHASRDGPTVSIATEALAYERFLTGWITESLDLGKRSWDASRSVRSEHQDRRAAVSFANWLVHADRFTEAEGLLLRERDRARSSGIRWTAIMYTRVLALMYVAAGRWTEATAEAEEAEHIPGSADVGTDRVPLLVWMSTIAARRGDLPGATRLIETASDAARHRGRFADVIAAGRAAIAEAMGERDVARELLREAVATAELRGFLVRLRSYGGDLVRLEVAAGEHALAIATTERVELLASRANVASIDALALYCRGLVEGDSAQLVRAVDAFRCTPRLPDLARACEQAGSVLSRDAAGLGRASAYLREALGLYETIGAASDEARVSGMLRGLGLRRGTRGPRRRALTGWQSLTESERRVAGLVAEGLANGEIAQRLFISRRTVETHVSHVYGKFGVSSRVQLAAALARAADRAPPDGHR